MSSSRSIAAARARRGNEQAPPVNGQRPVTSIGSQAAFANMQPPAPTNIRIARGPPPQQHANMYQQMPPPPSQMYQQMPPPPQQPTSNGLPFSKLSISDAIGLITLRLGRVEQFIIDLENGEQQNLYTGSNLPENSKIIDSSVLSTLVSRIDSLEKKDLTHLDEATITKINEDIKTLNEGIKNLNNELVKSNLSNAKHSEQFLRFERDFVENKDILKTLLMKFDQFVIDTNNKFSDFDYAIAEIEKNIPLLNEENVGSNEENIVLHEENVGSNEVILNENEQENSVIMSVDLKNMIKQELSFGSS
jgi:hypothetical protein